jgi:hypothetical protein
VGPAVGAKTNVLPLSESNQDFSTSSPWPSNISYIKVMAKFSLEQAMKAQRESRGIALLFL